MARTIHARPLIAGLSLISALAIFAILWNFNSDVSWLPKNRPMNPVIGNAYGLTPYVTSWTSWFSPQAWENSGNTAHNAGFISQDWNILYHLGGNGPWIQKTEGVVTNNIGPPTGCKVQQVHMLSRHGERYPTNGAGAKMLDAIRKLNATTSSSNTDFAFLNDWQFFVEDPARQFEQLTMTGPYSGTLETFATGVKFRTRYRHLVPTGTDSEPLKVWASGSERVEATARYFSLGLFGIPLEASTAIEVIPETPERGADTLTPSDGCIRYKQDEKNGHDFGNARLAEFQNIYLAPVLKRFQKILGAESGLAVQDIYSMQEMCGFEMTARGKSPWCDLFTKDEWEAFEYARDLYHFYRSGPGNTYSKALGSPWLNATSRLLAKGPGAGPFFFSFTHDSDMIPTFGVLGLLHDAQPLPSDRVVKARSWKTTQVVPMGGRLVIESISCRAGTASSNRDRYIRININDGIVAVPGCTSGPGSSCPLDQFLSYLQKRLVAASDFKSTCGLPEDSPDGISFLHQK